MQNHGQCCQYSVLLIKIGKYHTRRTKAKSNRMKNEEKSNETGDADNFEFEPSSKDISNIHQPAEKPS